VGKEWVTKEPSTLKVRGKNKPPAARVAKPLKPKHLESRLQMRFAPRSSGQITSAFDSGLTWNYLTVPVCQTHSFKSGKSLAPGRAAGGIFNLGASGDEGGEAMLGKNTLNRFVGALCPSSFGSNHNS
jgi:hypothetical protein